MPWDDWVWGALAASLVMGWALGWWTHKRQAAPLRDWPRKWNLNARPVFTAQERALFHDLRHALPNHVVLAKINVLRFCQATPGAEARRWYDRLHTINVGFAICTINGTVISVIDVESSKQQPNGRAQRMKEATLEACRVRYVRCTSSSPWPQRELLAAWALGQPLSEHSGAPPSVPGPLTTPLMDAGDQLARKLRERRAERAARWAESSFAQDSFFAFDARDGGPLTTSPVPLSDTGTGH